MHESLDQIVQSVLRTLSSLNIYLWHILSSDGVLNSIVINQHIPLNNGSILALLQNSFDINYSIPHGSRCI